MKIYVATLSPPEEFRGFYSSAAAEIQKLGHMPYDPFGPDGALLPWPSRLEALIGSQCQGLYLLKGWQNSVYATVEHHICLKTGKVILFQSAEERKSTLDQEKLAIIEKVTGAIHEATGMTIEEYRIRLRKETNVFARMIFSHHCIRAGLTPSEIGTVLDRNKSMIYHYFNRYDDECKYTPSFRETAAWVDNSIG